MMACLDNMQLVNGDYEREEGEIVDELDELSDISSEEEFLLRQRLQVLENYNNVLERKKAKRSSIGHGKHIKHNDTLLCDLSEISATELDDPYVVGKNVRQQHVKANQHIKTNYKPKRRRAPLIVNQLGKKEYRKKTHKYKKKVVWSDSESDDEYRNKRRKLEEAVAVNKTKIDKTSLKARLTKMLHGSINQEDNRLIPNIQTEYHVITEKPVVNESLSENNQISHPTSIDTVKSPNDITKKLKEDSTGNGESIDLCSDSEAKDSGINGSTESLPREGTDTVDSATKDLYNEEKVVNETQQTRDSDEDLELLRQHALKTKVTKTKPNHAKDKENVNEKKHLDDKDMLLLSEDEDSDTAELRLICLKSALLKKAIEMKQKQKLRKRLESANLNEELMNDQAELLKQIIPENNTDTESVDMDIGSDADEKTKDSSDQPKVPNTRENDCVNESRESRVKLLNNQKEDEFEEDEDLLRANLLTSLSKNLPKLVDPNIIKTIDDNNDSKPPQKESESTKQVHNVPEEKRFIINVANSDSEGEHEATKNLTKMHMKLSEQSDFQQKLDLFLKSTRMQVENSTLPDVVQNPEAPSPKTKEKFVPKTVKHLPKSEQIEYKNLVKRMAELEKIKNARQSSMNLNKGATPAKVTLKPRNVTIDSRKSIPNTALDEQIALSRKNIAEESAKVLKLKEEALKLSQKYKIVATELRNISTAIALNKKEQRSSQIRLSKIRAQHKLLLNSSMINNHSISNSNVVSTALGLQKTISNTVKRPQKENDPKEDCKNPQILRTVQVSVVNDLKADVNDPNPRLSIQIEVASNKKTVKIPKDSDQVWTPAVENSIEPRETDQNKTDSLEPLDDRGGGNKKSRDPGSNWGISKVKDDDYKSPLQALRSAKILLNEHNKRDIPIWEEDPNAVLCPFEVGGNCKDVDCKYLHPKTVPDQ